MPREVLEQRYPGVRIVGTYAPFHGELAQMDHSEILNRIHAARPDILLVAFGNPKQEKWIWMHRKRLGVPVAMGVGASFDILVGDVKRAPRWVQRCGMEWLMRCAQEPSRLGPRYLRDFAALARRLPLALVSHGCRRRLTGQSTVTTANDSACNARLRPRQAVRRRWRRRLSGDRSPHRKRAGDGGALKTCGRSTRRDWGC